MLGLSLEQWYAIAHTLVEAALFVWAMGRRADKAIINHIRVALKDDFLTRVEGRQILHKLDRLLERDDGRTRRQRQD